MSDRIDLATIWEVAQKVALPVLLGVAGWAFTAISDHETRLTRIEATRYTIQDARADRDEAAEQRRALEALLIRLDQRFDEVDRRTQEILARLQSR